MDLTHKIKDATEAVQQLPPLFEAIGELFKTPVGWAILFGFFIWLVINKDFSNIFSFMGKKERQHLENLELYLIKPELADQDSAKVLRDLRDAYYFKIATGIYAEKNLRLALIKLHAQNSHEINWGTIRRAYAYIQVDVSQRINVRKLTLFENFGYFYNEFVGYGSFFLAAGIFSFFILLENKNLTSFAYGIGGAFAMVFFGFFAFALNKPERAAKKIQSELEKSQNQTSEENNCTKE